MFNMRFLLNYIFSTHWKAKLMRKRKTKISWKFAIRLLIIEYFQFVDYNVILDFTNLVMGSIKNINYGLMGLKKKRTGEQDVIISD